MQSRFDCLATEFLHIERLLLAQMQHNDGCDFFYHHLIIDDHDDVGGDDVYPFDLSFIYLVIL